MTRLAFTNGLVLALETIRSHKLRAFLTVPWRNRRHRQPSLASARF